MLALALTGCGRKSNLDLPPQAAAQGQPAAAEGQPGDPRRTNQLGLFDPVQEDTPAAVPGQKRRIFLDRILD